MAVGPLLHSARAGAQRASLPVIAVLSEGIESDLAARAIVTALRAGLEDEGLVEGRDLRLELAFVSFYPQFIPDRIQTLASEGLQAIVSLSSVATRAAAAVTSVPIVMAPNADPVAEGLIESLARPGGTVTGVSMQSDELWRKKISLLGEAVQGLTRLAIMGATGTAGQAKRLERAVATADSMGLAPLALGVQDSRDLRPLLEKAVADGAPGLLLLEDVAFIGRQRSVIAYYALRLGLPTIAADRSYAEDGILMSYGANVQALQRRVARYVRQVLEGADPSTLPVEQPVRFELVINLETAGKLGIELPRSLLLHADDLIE